MRVVSLFDGKSCGQIALRQNGVVVEKYYASEIDKFAIGQTKLNFPDTIHLGDVERWREWDIDWIKIDLILAGSPCQGFSFAGKQLNFSDPRSKLFFVFVDILNHCKKINPDVKFLLENVQMKKEYLRVISEHVGVFPENINSNLVSAQNRNRWYWSNIKTKKVGMFGELYTDIPQPEDRCIFLKDILQPENEVDEKYYISDKALARILRKNYSKPKINPDKTGALNCKNNSGQLSVDGGTTLISDSGLGRSYQKRTKKSDPLRAGTGCSHNNVVLIQRGHGFNKGAEYTDKSPTITGASWKDNHTLKVDKNLKPKADQDKAAYLTGGGHSGGNHSDMDIICTSAGVKYRRLTPLECSRLQTVPAWYRWACSDSQAYKMLGNGWTVETIMHILKPLNVI